MNFYKLQYQFLFCILFDYFIKIYRKIKELGIINFFQEYNVVNVCHLQIIKYI